VRIDLRIGALLFSAALLTACASQAPAPELRGTGDLGLVIERASGKIAVVDTTQRTVLGEIAGLGDLSHASVVFARDGRFAFVFGRDGALTRVDLLTRRITHRVQQAGNAIGGAISQDGHIVVAQNYEPGGIRAFDADTLAPLADVPSTYGADGKRSKVVGLADLPGNRFAYALFDAGEIWVTDLSDPKAPRTEKYRAGLQPYDGLVTPDGRYYLAGLFGEDGLALLDLWRPEQGVRKVLRDWGRGEEKLPVYKMPHLRGWAMADGYLWLPAIGRHQVWVVDTRSWQQVAQVPVAGQPVFVMARPDGRQIWVNFAFPDNGKVQVIDSLSRSVVKTLEPGRAVLHLEFQPRGGEVWLSARDDNRVSVINTDSFDTLASFAIDAPSGIFFTTRAARIGF